ncbi:sulfotransferase [Thalassoroseus pseudoceratinae]|uniref:sulfotransferase n=1 Tax=Thalassoroseus pseudoceratinae TaxID=2713176 RepID=UPI00197D920F|nr:sulfotransferase [Thalassoroseus pseudoceratinae]
MLGPVRSFVRQKFFGVLRQALQTQDGREILADAFPDLTSLATTSSLRTETGLGSMGHPYANLGTETATDRKPFVIISSRFRSGSTFLWNLFRHLPNCTAYYEPFNDRRWFDPESRGSRVDTTHRAVDDYWREYDGLEHLAEFYQFDWIQRRLFMPAVAVDPRMHRYIRELVDAASGLPVLQFNRVDFRLPWLRRQFPEAKIIQLIRHPRDVWNSMTAPYREVKLDDRLGDFDLFDLYSLGLWVQDLKLAFPFLHDAENEHPYRAAYLIWKLSCQFGQQYADGCYRYEDLIGQPLHYLREMFSVAGVTDIPWEELLALVKPPTPDRWRGYADEAWFQAHEAECDQRFAAFFGAGTLEHHPSTEITPKAQAAENAAP